jgi:hypothetical protein
MRSKVAGMSAGPQRAAPGNELECFSPELALVDPELAATARALLPDAPWLVAAPRPAPAAPARAADQVVFVESLREALEPVAAADEAPTGRRARLRPLAAAGLAALAVVGVVVVTTLVRDERGPQLTQAAVANAGPVESTATTPPDVAIPPRDQPLSGQTFVWAAAPDATAYEFQLFRNSERIYRRRVTSPRLDLPARWRLDGNAHVLASGSYRWYVWPITGRGNEPDSVAIVRARLVVEGQEQ